MIESVVLAGVAVLFKAAFAGDDLDRKVGAQMIGSVIDGLLRTTSTTDPVLLQIHKEVRELKTAPYDQAMASGHRYLQEARLSAKLRDERLRKARDQLVDAASAAKVLKVPLLIANAEFAIAKCDVLLGEPEHAEMALRAASTAIESAIEGVDVSTWSWRSMVDAKYEQEASMSKWFERLTSGDLIKKGHITAAEAKVREAVTTLAVLTDLYSEVQTATLAAAGWDNAVVWGQSEEPVTAGLRDKAVASAPTGVPVSGFGLMLIVERQVVWRPEGDLVVDLLMRVTASEDRRLYCRADSGYGTPNAASPDAAAVRASHPAPWLVAPGLSTFNIGKGSYWGWLRIPSEGESLEVVNIRSWRQSERGHQVSTDACVRIPISG